MNAEIERAENFLFHVYQILLNEECVVLFLQQMDHAVEGW